MCIRTSSKASEASKKKTCWNVFCALFVRAMNIDTKKLNFLWINKKSNFFRRRKKLFRRRT